jgi:hypothetical protein
LLLKEDDSVNFVGMKFWEKYFCKNFFLTLIIFLPCIFLSQKTYSQQPSPPSNIHPQHITPMYLLNIVPKNGGKSYTLFHKTKVNMTLKNGTIVSGKVRGVSRDSIAIDLKSYAVSDIDELRFNPGSALGVAAAIATTLGLIAIAATIDAEQTDTRNAILYTGIGLAVVGGALLIPTYFVKKKFTSAQYDFASVMIGGY